MSKQSLNGNQNNISKLFDLVNSVIYAIAGFLFILVAFFALVYSIWNFIATIQSSHWQLPFMASVIIQFVSDLLLVLIIMEVFRTVKNQFEENRESLMPYLYIGIISAVRGILSVGAKILSVGEKPSEFSSAMIELGVNAAVILALGVTIKLLKNLFPKDRKEL